ncbi:MAG: ATPase [Tannerella sp.]|nr:ATPase [Tannerella sp.]
MILIADSGTTKTDWCAIEPDGSRLSFQSNGMNPYFRSEDELSTAFAEEVSPLIPDGDTGAVYFYGSGCTFDKIEVMKRVIGKHIPATCIEVYSDLLAAAHATCGREAGIACIIGTGSNSCFYDGRQIVKNVPPLGYILGDEGGGVSLGRRLVGDVLKEMLSPAIREKFFDQYKLTAADIIDRVYRRPYPNRFLAGFSPFIAENIAEPEIRKTVLDSFIAFLTRNVMKYDYKRYPANFVGSVAYVFREILSEAANATGIGIASVHPAPMRGLITYYTN